MPLRCAHKEANPSSNASHRHQCTHASCHTHDTESASCSTPLRCAHKEANPSSNASHRHQCTVRAPCDGVQAGTNQKTVKKEARARCASHLPASTTRITRSRRCTLQCCPQEGLPG